MMPVLPVLSRRLWLAIGVLAAVAIAGVVYLVRPRGDSDVLPPAVVRAIDIEKAERPRIDSTVRVALDSANAALADRDSAQAHASRSERAARAIGHLADSLAAVAREAASARDSAKYWQLAYAARTLERDTLLETIDTLRRGIARAGDASNKLRFAVIVADSGRHHADSVLDATVHAAVAANCRVPLTLGLVKCMSRMKAALTGAAIGVSGKVVVDAIRDGRVKIPLPFLRGAP